MKVDKQLPVITGIDTQGQRPTGLRENAPVKNRRSETRQLEQSQAERSQGKGASFNLQLNQQLSSMQSAESYLDQLASRLRQLKLNLSRELSGGQPSEREGLKQAMGEVRQLLAERSERSAGTLDANLRLRLNEPVRSRFSIQGLESIEQVQQAGKETLLFGAGRKLAEPLAVVLDEGMSTEQVLRRFNAGLGQAGFRAELEQGGVLKFSARESDWQELRGQLTVQGEGKLAGKAPSRVQTQEEELISFPEEVSADSQRELRRVLDNVVSALDRVSAIRDQISHRQQEIREFLARQAEQDESQWARDYAGQVFNLMQTVVAQANLSRFSVVSLLS
jgi:hypothetical protein